MICWIVKLGGFWSGSDIVIIIFIAVILQSFDLIPSLYSTEDGLDELFIFLFFILLPDPSLLVELGVVFTDDAVIVNSHRSPVEFTQLVQTLRDLHLVLAGGRPLLQQLHGVVLQLLLPRILLLLGQLLRFSQSLEISCCSGLNH